MIHLELLLHSLKDSVFEGTNWVPELVLLCLYHVIISTLNYENINFFTGSWSLIIVERTNMLGNTRPILVSGDETNIINLLLADRFSVN
jgi:hypothetical protein